MITSLSGDLRWFLLLPTIYYIFLLKLNDHASITTNPAMSENCMQLVVALPVEFNAN